MANEAFALSPISARAAEPNEADYDAIREAFMETARGRWFLTEYAKRNRNSDTSMVLDAVARIEQSLAAQRQPVIEDRLPEALVTIRRAIREAETIAIAAFDPGAIETSLGPIHRAIRIVREISWRWREIGADGRICDLIDSQLAAIEAACGQLSTIDPRSELKAAFDLLRDQVESTDADHARPVSAEAAPIPEAAEADASTVAASDASIAPAEIEPAVQEMSPAATADSAPMIEAEAATWGDEPDPDGRDDADFAESLDPAVLDAADAEDDAVLERIALEMAAPDPDFDAIVDEPGEPPAPAAEVVMAESAVLLIPTVHSSNAPVEASPVAREPWSPPQAQPPLHPAPPAPAEPEPSLGASLLASGLVQAPRAAAPDPLLPIRRMTQVEKIAFFS